MTQINTCIATTFVALGALENRSNRVYNTWDQGTLELHSVFAQIAETLDAVVNVAAKECLLDFPGVFHYEVSEPIGTWLGDRILDSTGWAFNSQEVYDKVLYDSVEFFGKDLTEFEKGRLYGVFTIKVPFKEITW